MSVRWGYLDGAGNPVGGSGSFPERGAAEDWLSEAWEELADRGVVEVELRDEEHGTALYRMALGPA